MCAKLAPCSHLSRFSFSSLYVFILSFLLFIGVNTVSEGLIRFTDEFNHNKTKPCCVYVFRELMVLISITFVPCEI